MIWQSPWAFWLLIPLAIVVLAWIFLKRRRRPSLPFSQLALVSGAPFSLRVFLKPLPGILQAAGLAFMIIALARPQSAKERSEQNVKGIDIMIVMDISLSMLAADMGEGLTRLEASKRVVADFIRGRVSDRMGLIVFSGESYTRVPLTMDYGLLLRSLSAVESTEDIKEGTAIGLALANGAARLKHSPPESRVIVFLTDGENNTGFIGPSAALKIARRNKIKVYAIGLGSVSGTAPIKYKTRDSFGRPVIQRMIINSRINKELMKRMADETGGAFFMAKNTGGLQEIFGRINKMEKQEIKVSQWMEYKELFPPFLQAGAALYFLSLFLSLTVFFRGI